MNFSQVIMLLLMVNLLIGFTNFTFQSNDLQDVSNRLNDWFSNEKTGLLRKLSDFSTVAQQDQNWFVEKIGDIAQSFTQAINVAILGAQIVLLVLYALVPFPFLSKAQTPTIPIIQFIGYLSLIILYWYQIFLVTRLYKLIKGIDK